MCESTFHFNWCCTHVLLCYLTFKKWFQYLNVSILNTDLSYVHTLNTHVYSLQLTYPCRYNALVAHCTNEYNVWAFISCNKNDHAQIVSNVLCMQIADVSRFWFCAAYSLPSLCTLSHVYHCSKSCLLLLGASRRPGLELCTVNWAV